MLIKGAVNMNVEESKAIIDMKEEIFKLNNLVVDMIKELKINVGIKIESENSKEIDDIKKTA
jgi:hypothetical protein